MPRRPHGWGDKEYKNAQYKVRELFHPFLDVELRYNKAKERKEGMIAWPFKLEKDLDWQVWATRERYREAHYDPTEKNIQSCRQAIKATTEKARLFLREIERVPSRSR